MGGHVHLHSRTSSITPIVGNVSRSLSYQAYPRARTTQYHSLVFMDALGNNIGEGGAVALVEPFKGMQNMKELNLAGF